MDRSLLWPRPTAYKGSGTKWLQRLYCVPLGWSLSGSKCYVWRSTNQPHNRRDHVQEPQCFSLQPSRGASWASISHQTWGNIYAPMRPLSQSQLWLIPLRRQTLQTSCPWPTESMNIMKCCSFASLSFGVVWHAEKVPRTPSKTHKQHLRQWLGIYGIIFFNDLIHEDLVSIRRMYTASENTLEPSRPLPTGVLNSTWPKESSSRNPSDLPLPWGMAHLKESTIIPSVFRVKHPGILLSVIHASPPYSSVSDVHISPFYAAPLPKFKPSFLMSACILASFWSPHF